MTQNPDSAPQTSFIRTLPIQICDPGSAGAPASELPILDFISSDATLDRYAESIDPSGWKLDSYLRNPVFQNSHQYGDILFTLGKALVTEVRAYPLPSDGRGIKGEGSRSALFQRIQFATDANPMARIAYNLYKGKFLSAVSVGFIPTRWEDGTEKTAYTRKYLEQELLEVSAVAIPANPNALALGLKSGAVEKSDLKDLFDLLRLTLDPNSKSSSSSFSSSSSISLPPQQTTPLEFLRQLHTILKS
jgi:HK97 family phage prohead protease